MIILGLGCNIGDRMMNLRTALKLLKQKSELKVQKASPLYESDALLLPNSPPEWNQPFLNLAIEIRTSLDPEQLLMLLKKIERDMGRISKFRWSPRIIDIDILAWGEYDYNSECLNIPHIELLNRPFALWPLADLNPDWKYSRSNHPDFGKRAEVLVERFGSRFSGKAPFRTRQITHRVDTPKIMGILNLTPDSFSDGGSYSNLDQAIDGAQQLFEAGAEIIDVGAESTRPSTNTKVLSAKEEWDKLFPFLEKWRDHWKDNNFRPALSIDTSKSQIVEKLLDNYEVDFFNIVGNMNDQMLVLLKDADAKIIFMHNLGLPSDSKVNLPEDEDVISLIYHWGEQHLNYFYTKGIDSSRIIFDVGLGFGKDSGQSLKLINNLEKFRDLSVELLAGHSRKSFLNKFTSRPFSERDLETSFLSGFLYEKQVNYLRIHNVDYTMRLLKIKIAMEKGSGYA